MLHNIVFIVPYQKIPDLLFYHQYITPPDSIIKSLVMIGPFD